RMVLAVPDCRDIEFAVSTGGGSTARGVRVAPALTVVPVEDGAISEYEYVEGEGYSRGGLWPARAATVSEPRWLSRQRIVHVEFYPCQVDPVEGTLVSHDEIEVRLSFVGVRESAPPARTSARWERLYGSVLANYESGRAWRTRPAAARDVPTEYFASSSNWLKLTVDRRGIYRIGYDDLTAAGVDPSSVDPASIRVFTGTGLELDPNPTVARPDWMTECTIEVTDGGDGAFDSGDRVVFYAVSGDAWSDELAIESPQLMYHTNTYTGTTVYWMTWESDGTPFADPPLRMAEDDLQNDPSPLAVDDYRARAHYEDNPYEHPLGTGANFYMFEMKQRTPEHRYFHERLTHVVTDSTGILRARVDGNSTNYVVYPDHVVYFYLNNVEAYLGEWDGFGDLIFEADGLPFRDYLPGEPGDDYNTFDVFVARADADHLDDRVWIDWFEFKYWRNLWADMDSQDEVQDDLLAFGSSGRAGVLEYSIDGFETDEVSVYKIVDRYTVLTVPGVVTSGGGQAFGATFQDAVSETTSYIAVSTGGYLVPGISRDTYQGLRADTEFDYVIIVYDGFYDEALRLKNFRESAEGGGFDVRLVRVSDVYDEFSWGMVDPAAIRDYLKYLNDVAVVPPTHVLLIGDGTFDFRHYLTTGVDSFMPSYYTGGSEHWPTDSWFVGFDAVNQYEPGMAIGRLSARSSGELSTAIDKILRYETDVEQGVWKNTVVLIGDDEWRGNNTDPTPHLEYAHTEQAEQISREILPWAIDRLKIYLMEYEFDAAWHKPAARVDLVEAWNEGALVLNYTGHGGEQVMAHELVFVIDDVPRLTNISRLPIFFAASCRLNKFDMPNSDSVGELLVKSPVGGAIGAIGSTRDSGAGYNSALNRSFLWNMFGQQREAPTIYLDMGQALQAGFIESGASAAVWLNNTKFALIGDPALTLVSPEGGGLIDEEGVSPMRRRDRVSVTGHNAGATAGGDGVALVRVTDSADTSGYIQPETLYHVEYELPGETIFEGASVVSGGDFTSEFVVSALAAEGPKARIRAYFYDGEEDGSFSLEEVTIADSVDVSDVTGPDISLSFEGGSTTVMPGAELTIRLSDEYGINLVNDEPGQGIDLLIDGGSDSTDITDQFVYDLGSSREGAILHELESLG
ncbi:MAG TPA: C25 family cysteine peptidase, partial [bacterium]|nr:C25 family cysteine peptidase [bacterium]